LRRAKAIMQMHVEAIKWWNDFACEFACEFACDANFCVIFIMCVISVHAQSQDLKALMLHRCWPW
jgi:hypothetical protein